MRGGEACFPGLDGQRVAGWREAEGEGREDRIQDSFYRFLYARVENQSRVMWTLVCFKMAQEFREGNEKCYHQCCFNLGDYAFTVAASTLWNSA